MTNPIDYEARVKFCEERIESLGEDVDPGDIFTILGIIWDADDSGIPFYEWFENSRIARDIMESTQSNYQRGWNRIHRMGILDERMMEYQIEIDDAPLSLPE